MSQYSMIPIVVQNGTPLIWNASGNRLLIKFLINTQQMGRLGTVVVFAPVFQGLIPGVFNQSQGLAWGFYL